MQINISEIENKQNLKKRLIQSDRKANSLQKYGMYKYTESPDFEILLVKSNAETQLHTLGELLPLAFTPKSLK